MRFTRAGKVPDAVAAITDGGELAGAAGLGALVPHSPNQFHREDAEGVGVPFLPLTRPGKGPRGSRHGRPGGACRS
jgi:hypothetical protein